MNMYVKLFFGPKKNMVTSSPVFCLFFYTKDVWAIFMKYTGSILAAN